MNIIWFRRDLRLNDHVALTNALASGEPVLPLFIFDTDIIDELSADDARINFIYDQLFQIHNELAKQNSGILIHRGRPEEIFKKLIEKYSIKSVFTNRDYEPYAIKRDKAIELLLKDHGIEFYTYKDQVIHEPHEVLKSDGSPYTVYTPYKNSWLKKFESSAITIYNTPISNLFRCDFSFPGLEALGFKKSTITVMPYDLTVVPKYDIQRDIPHLNATSYLGPHLRFGTVSIRALINKIKKNSPGNSVFLNELIWREFFFQILYHFPHVVHSNFRSKYNGVQWRNNEEDFKRWCKGETGYPIVDAGMRQLNETGYMHNRVRMITAGFLCKHLLIDWKWGEAYFAKKLLDYELSSNNGNWQWAASTGCDSQPYFRVFNPWRQQEKFDKDCSYIKKWIPELKELSPKKIHKLSEEFPVELEGIYPKPCVDHSIESREAIRRFKEI